VPFSRVFDACVAAYHGVEMFSSVTERGESIIAELL